MRRPYCRRRLFKHPWPVETGRRRLPLDGRLLSSLTTAVAVSSRTSLDVGSGANKPLPTTPAATPRRHHQPAGRPGSLQEPPSRRSPKERNVVYIDPALSHRHLLSNWPARRAEGARACVCGVEGGRARSLLCVRKVDSGRSRTAGWP